MLGRPRRVLIVDDDESVRSFVAALMAGEGWHTLEGRTGEDAIDLAASERPDLIILDVLMPVTDGFEAFRRLRSDLTTKDIPIIMLTAINELEPGDWRDEVWMEEKFGVQRPEAFVDKPVDPDFLLNAIFGVVG